MTVTILRQHYQYELTSSQVYQTTIISTIKCDNSKTELFLIPVEDVLEDLEIRDQDGKHLTVLSESELESKFGVDKKTLLSENPDYESVRDKKFDVIPVLLDPHVSEYRKIFCTYISAIKEDIYAKTKVSLDMNIVFRFKIIPSEYINRMLDKKPFDIHVMFKIADDYRINKGEHVNLYVDDKKKIIKSQDHTEHSRSWFIPGADFHDVIVGRVNIGLTNSLLSSARAIALLAFFVPTFMVGLQWYEEKFFLPTLEILVGALALLIGSQFWVLKDRYLMIRWKILQKGLILYNGILFMAWFFAWLLLHP